LGSITLFLLIVMGISRCNVIVIVIDYIVNVIVISYYFHDYTRCLIINMLYHARGMVCYVRQKLAI